MRCFLVLLLFALSPLTLANPYDQATKLIARGDKQQAWKLLYPLAANEQDARAQIILGQMLLSSPGVEDHLEKAMRMFSAAKRNGHPAGDHFVGITKQQMDFSQKAERRVSNAKRYYAQAEREHRELSKKLEKGFLNGDGEIFGARVDVFVKGDTGIPRQVEKLIQRDSKLSKSVLTTFHLVFDRSQLGNANPFTSTFEPPESGFEPDIDGALASQLGVEDYPSIVVREAANRTPNIMTFDQLQQWSHRWRNNDQ